MTNPIPPAPSPPLPARPSSMALCITRNVLASAHPMTMKEFRAYMGRPATEDPPLDQPGALVESFYPPLPSNDERHRGEIIWMPAEDFDRTFSPGHTMTFGQALEAVRRDWIIAREEWEEGKRVRLHASSRNPYLACQLPMREVAYWQPTQADMLATDWKIVGDDAPPVTP